MAGTKRIMPDPRALDPLPLGTRALLRPGRDAVAYHIPTTPYTEGLSPLKTTIVLPRQSAWTSGLHFHTTHAEYLHLVKGAIFVELNGETKLISALSGGEVDTITGGPAQEGLIVEVPRYARHNWGRLDHFVSTMRRGGAQRHVLPEDWTEEVIVEEWTDPSDIGKPLFFWNLNGVITASSETVLSMRQQIARRLLGDWWIGLQLFMIFWELDNWPVLFDLRNLPLGVRPTWTLRLSDGAEVATSFMVLWIAQAFGKLLGLQAVVPQRTPHALWEAYRKPPRSL